METCWNQFAIFTENNRVGNPLLSERDGNCSLFTCVKPLTLTCRKPTTLWKRWKPWCFLSNYNFAFSMSETHYSLKEMETLFCLYRLPLLLLQVGNPLLSERDGNFRGNSYWVSLNISGRKPTTLWKRWKPAPSPVRNVKTLHSRKPTTLWKRWKLVFNSDVSWRWVQSRKPTTLWKRWKLFFWVCLLFDLHSRSETHYSLKEMETLQNPLHYCLHRSKVGNPLLSERDGNKLYAL